MVNKQNSNATKFYISEEKPGEPKVVATAPIWREKEPNSYADFGGEYSQVARNPINASRQRKKGTLTDLDVPAGYSVDLTKSSELEDLQGFLFADAHEKFATNPFNGTAVTITGVTATDDRYAAASGLSTAQVGSLMLAAGFTNVENNGLVSVSAKAAGYIAVDQALVDETPATTATLETVGFQFNSGDAEISVTGAVAQLTTSVKDLTELDLNIGEFIFVGGDATALKFATCPVFYGRILSIAANAIVFDKVTGTAVTDAGTSKTIQIFFGKYIRNEKTTSLIKTRTYQLEMQLGNDAVGVQSMYATGAYPNELKLNMPTADKITMDLGYVALDEEFRDGATGIKAGTRVASKNEEAINTSTDVYRTYLNVIDKTSLQPSAMFAYITQADITINNNISPDKAISVFGGFDATVGTFTVSGSVNAYFTDLVAKQAIKANSDITLDIIVASKNSGYIFDLPLVGAGDGRQTIEQDQAIEVPVTLEAVESDAGYTLSVTNFAYLPTEAMPT